VLAQVVSALLGIWLMAAPDIVGYGGPARLNDRVVGPLAASFAFIAVWQVTRPLRWLNLALGAWLLLAPWALGYELAPRLNSLVVGLVLVVLAAVSGKVQQRFGGGWASLLSHQRLDAD
jgi:hypothetical protein